MDRRKALKRMGAMAMGTLFYVSGITSLSSCNGKKKRVILYFTGTGDCEFCFACIHNCPQKAIQFNREGGDPLLANGEKNPNARYRNEHISLADIKRANKV